MHTSFKLLSPCITTHLELCTVLMFAINCYTELERKEMALFQPCSTRQHELLSELPGCLWCLLYHICSVGASSTCRKGQHSLFSFAGKANGFIRHKPLLEHLSLGSLLSRDSDDMGCKTDYPTTEKLKSSIFFPPLHHLLHSLCLSEHTIVLCLNNPEIINTCKSPRTATKAASHYFPFYSNPRASRKALFILLQLSHMFMETSSSHRTVSGLPCLLQASMCPRSQGRNLCWEQTQSTILAGTSLYISLTSQPRSSIHAKVWW